MTQFAPFDAAELPASVVAYLDARDAQDRVGALATFTADAVVIDDGGTYSGTESIGSWIGQSSTEFTYTATRIGQQLANASDAVVQVRLDGNFPGGTVTLHYQFELSGDLISRLAIEV